MIPPRWREGEVAVLGLARTGIAAARWLANNGFSVYASDASNPSIPDDVVREFGEIGVDSHIGGHDISRLEAASLVVVSPGIPPDATPLVAAREAGVEVVAELELAALALEATRLVVITGTNGKTTTTHLIGETLADAGVDSVVAGNIGDPLIAVASEGRSPDWAIVEASSFQLHDCHALRADVGVLTNLAPDHLDRYPGVAEYYADKKRLFQNASDESVWITCADDALVAELKGDVPGKDRFWSMSNEQPAWFDRASDRLVLDGHTLLPRSELGLLGDHNVSNALAAALVCSSIGVGPDGIATSIKQAVSLPHRMEVVTVGNVRWINDSKATNVSSTSVAIAAMGGRYVLIMGGRHKGESYSLLGPQLTGGDCVGLVAFGESAEAIRSDLVGILPVRVAENLENAVSCAASLDAPTVLFSPACSSFDQFDNYEHRGAEFKRLLVSP